jgi:hypothetical protein
MNHIIENTQKHPITVTFLTIDGFKKTHKFFVGKNEIDNYYKLSLEQEKNIKYHSLKKAKMLKDFVEKKTPKKEDKEVVESKVKG